ncbi:MAG TPA: tRNA (adenosine(37)-N6)-threonylcarbamoyltransferase complex ATPase subunit type 1 TsaE [Clostridiaceae bacterium]|jgi:tRNA threonylcarbamoyladenosine biosynthesis protein TsaE|nr:tRNA (adenosine(37)-N6)-threonylcarbamoyltransferase complex ATPase subunit type 1 TsaE [Clostridiaceae bacterium]HBX48536.1 tRNA (adenosine(37)-N6)-threonylcarbamoyltransferase complex ATPase subunit type 1 TsaE [Clostridiaceae bacterium]
MKVITNNENETYNIGIKIGKQLKAGDILSLNGDLGAGKTYLTKGIAKGLGVEDYITSPTFTILNEYEGRIPLYHFDVYRINDVEEMYEIGFEEYLYGNGVCVIEWGSVVEEILPKDTINIKIKSLGELSREIEIKSDRITLK